MKHIKLPLRRENRLGTFGDIVDAEGEPVAQVQPLSPNREPDMVRRNEYRNTAAEHVAACVNALAGLNPEGVKDALWALEQIITDLPANRDWLDPDVEKVARDALAKLKAPTP